jgi:hypothetical protein
MYIGFPRETRICPPTENNMPMCIHDYVQDNPNTPSKRQKSKNARANFVHELVCNMMYVHWREREHEDIDILVDENPTTMAALRQCRLRNLFRCPFMRAQPRLTNALVDYWHPDAEVFMLLGQLLNPTTEHI